MVPQNLRIISGGQTGADQAAFFARYCARLRARNSGVHAIDSRAIRSFPVDCALDIAPQSVLFVVRYKC